MPKHPGMADLALFPRLSHAGQAPADTQVYRCLIRLIDEGVLKAGTQLPGQEALAAHWRVGINTVRAAMRKLAGEGRLLLRHGLPTVVADRPAGPQKVSTRTEAERLHTVARSSARRRWGRPGWALLSDSQRQAFTALELLRLIARQRSDIPDRFVRELVEHGYHALVLDPGATEEEPDTEEHA